MRQYFLIASVIFLFFSSCTREKDASDNVGDYFFSGTIDGDDLTDNESSGSVEQNGAAFTVTEILVDHNFDQEDLNFEVVKAFQLRGTCNFKTENLSVENGEFSIRAVAIR